ncbi:hypothetical protein ABZ319_18055 [Nocardia sp. NPDC005978]|uniref:hypothetical protein n=1 Tax=Nocardia sp. NPDC005978 TaxID=3156725 RepID=UPI0033BC6006
MLGNPLAVLTLPSDQMNRACDRDPNPTHGNSASNLPDTTPGNNGLTQSHTSAVRRTPCPALPDPGTSAPVNTFPR